MCRGLGETETCAGNRVKRCAPSRQDQASGLWGSWVEGQPLVAPSRCPSLHVTQCSLKARREKLRGRLGWGWAQ